MILLKGQYVLTINENEDLIILKPGYVLIDNDRIKYVGNERPNTLEKIYIISVENGLILPGFIDIHYHTDTPLTKGFIEDVGSENFYGSILYEHLPAIYAATNVEDWVAITKLTMLEMIKNGITTCVEFNSYFPEELSIILTEMNIRGYISPEVNSLKRYPYSLNGKNIIFEEENEAHIFDKLNNNLKLIEKLNKTNNDLIRVTLGPTEPPACNPKLLKEIRKYAEIYKVPITMHAAETIMERNIIKEKYNRTSIEYLDENGITGKDVILGHVIYTIDTDVDILAKTKTNVAHCPTIFARRGKFLKSLQKYLNRGINVGIGTDTFPQDMIEEMKFATIMSKVADDNFKSAPSNVVYKCATINGAKALNRNDIGLLKVGNLADVIIINLDDLNLTPTRDPVKVLVNCGNGFNVHTTIINGKILMENRKCTFNDEIIVKKAKEAALRVWRKTKNIDRLSPLSIPIKE